MTRPVVEFTVATEVFELLQLPPEVPLLVYVDVCPMQSGDAPLTVPAFRPVFTVIVIALDVAVVGLAQASEEVMTTMTTSPFASALFE